LGKADQAEGYLSQAEWTVLQAPECPTALRHKLHRIAGLLYFTKGEYPKARRCLAEDVSGAEFDAILASSRLEMEFLSQDQNSCCVRILTPIKWGEVLRESLQEHYKSNRLNILLYMCYNRAGKNLRFF